MSAPLVTIGIPIYNGSNYLKAALSSILEEDHEHLEILIADNASTDDSLAIVSAVADGDPRVRILGSDTNRGAAWNYNRLVDEASGEYFKWAAHDDVCLPNYVSSCVGVLQTRPEVVLTYPQTSIIDSEGL
ncbi:MAG: glycosyltransferase family A protein, partial [Actinomycetota bacterium]|nr:glycosyltransferase family A protein [Actinomycetota bacterium]